MHILETQMTVLLISLYDHREQGVMIFESRESPSENLDYCWKTINK